MFASALRSWLLVLAFLTGAAIAPAEAPPQRPNVLLVFADDMGPELACYGHPAVQTPHLDRFASQGVRFTSAFTTAPSCTPSRNAIITGVYQTRTDTQDQRRRGIQLPDGVRPFTELLREAGYFTALGCRAGGYADKTDYNFVDAAEFDGKDWSQRAPGQPFFAQATLYVTHRNPPVGWGPVRAKSPDPVDPAQVKLPPYFPDDPDCRLDWATYLDTIEALDRQFGRLMKRLEREGLADNTVVFLIGDNGQCHLRGKCWLYDAGTHVPLLIRYRPGELSGPAVDRRLVSAVDVTATILDLAGVEPPPVFDGRPLNDPAAPARTEVFTARDQIDEVHDIIRAVRTERYKYIRNYRPELGYRSGAYLHQTQPMLPVLLRLAEEGKLNDVQKLYFAPTKPQEELYDVIADPYEVNNLASAPEHAEALASLRTKLDAWLTETGDRGLPPKN